MKKSNILKKAYNIIEQDTNINFVCWAIDDAVMSAYRSENQGKILIKWIEKHIKSKNSGYEGVLSWLKYKRCVHPYVTNYNNKELREYRLLWIKDMIAYWKHQGD